MARIRTIKPEIAAHEDLFDLERSTGLPIRFAWCMLFTVADREGRFRWRPRTLKAQILPHDELDFSRVLDAWLTRGFIVKYRVGEEWFGWIPTFTKHQVINNRESQSDLPALKEANETIQQLDACSTRAPRDDTHDIDASSTCEVHAQGEGRKEGEGKGRKEPEGKAEAKAPKLKVGGTPEDEAIAQRMFAAIQQVVPSAKQPGTWHPWANVVRLMREQDGRTHEQIWATFEWANRHQGNGNFSWGRVILSPGNLREHWTKLEAQRGVPAAGPAWWATSDSIMAKAKELGITTRGETAEALKAQIRERLGTST